MSDLIKALRKAVECKDKYGEHICYPRKVIEPLWDKVLAVVEAAEVAEQWYADEEPWKSLLGNAQKALSDLRLAVGEK